MVLSQEQMTVKSTQLPVPVGLYDQLNLKTHMYATKELETLAVVWPKPHFDSLLYGYLVQCTLNTVLCKPSLTPPTIVENMFAGG